MSPMYNPDDWNKEFDMILKYEPMNENTINRILTQYKHDDVLNYIKDLWNLIDYQRKTMTELNKQLISIRHKVAWKRYDLPETKFETNIDKPCKDGNMSC